MRWDPIGTVLGSKVRFLTLAGYSFSVLARLLDTKPLFFYAARFNRPLPGN